MRKQYEEKDTMEFVAEHAHDLIAVLKQSEGTTKVYVITYLLATVREEALSAISALHTGAMLQVPNSQP